MQISKDQFKANMLSTIVEAGIHFDVLNSKFTITPIKEDNVKYNTLDEYLRLWMFNEKNLNNRDFSLDEVIDFLVQPNQKFPLWINILRKEDEAGYAIFDLQISMRFRTPTQLRYIESGHPPFIFEKKS